MTHFSLCDGEKRVDDGPDKFMNCSKKIKKRKKKRARVRVFDFGRGRPIKIQTPQTRRRNKRAEKCGMDRGPREGGREAFMSPFPNLEDMYI